MSVGLELVGPMITSLVASVMAYSAKREFDKTDAIKEDKKVKEAIEKIKISVKDNDNIVELMMKNVKELREYYIISKEQARKSFSAALFICFFGICIYLLGIASYVFFDKDISIISIVGGTVVELIAGLFFWLYKEATKQLSIYHQRLGATEKYLIAYQMINEIPNDKKYEEQSKFIYSVLSGAMENNQKN